jgi:IclR family acetate operon transcriptional repressor
VESVARALDLLEALAEGDVGLVELGRQTGLQPSTTHRLLATLRKRGYVRRCSDTGHYALGLRPMRLASAAAQNSRPLVDAVKPMMLRVHRVSGETTNLFSLEGSDVVYLDQLVDDSAERMASEFGRALPAHATAAGKAILAFAAPDVAVEALGSGELERFTEHTIVGPRLLSLELAAIRKRGYALGSGEFASWATCIAAPIFDDANQPVAALSVSASTGRLKRVASAEELGELVGATAMDASFALGYEGPSRWHVPPPGEKDVPVPLA